jgi:hypothetical protein
VALERHAAQSIHEVPTREKEREKEREREREREREGERD